jgi:tRNA A64-2'-O-ribosylphosphate transferase
MEICWRDTTVQPSFSQVLKALKRRESGVYNCLNSVLADSAFVEEVAALYPDLPVLANLRCGLWYVAAPDGTCYFKSTDGHFGQWAFSLTRLNLATALLAARAGGVLIVDATRRGKTFPVSV